MKSIERQYQDEIDGLRAKLESLRPYMKHLTACATLDGKRCDCGLLDTLMAADME